MRSETEVQKSHVNIGEIVNSLDQWKEREVDRTLEISIEDVRHDTTRTGGDSVYFRRIDQKNDRKPGKEEEKRVLRTFGTAIESLIGSALEESSKTVNEDIFEGEGNTQMQHDQKTPGVRKNIVIGQPKEPLPGRLANRLSEWKKIGGDKLVSHGKRARWRSPQSPISLEERKHRQEFRGTTEMTNNYLSLLEE
ncbi:uncharacterized protein MONOS_16316 [Monocercomonoides exilis]|uniref:uncharacterized protein n=1 Tax=Monocercomonoides exilis TaxID=2049356 RepID=UPI00355A54CE|nr:hypothetical protein MONOS_16316 [Monocercomonoides exilis]|eukprot:MONOS_16316.1-p1 / transcript=MONOS_16316.1 / gene=MONOS_16316 / organism=Monocercomonoides_exilis_PA203 / gene_product=unspecified product / transcript_product=unspecified product / location=Mono_scaffold01641:4382-4963(-) / protein_length=194 / sequence_SO=supercontig / SO=protein_coding / is_pseudo=false